MKHLAREFIYLRHGQTDANLQHLLCGQKWNLPLNANGLAQAEAAAKAIKSAYANLGSICVSPLTRAQQTADIVSKQFDSELHVIDELSEWDLGEWDRKPYQELKDLFHSEINPEGGETRAALNDRISRALELSLSKPGPVLIVAHGEVWRALRRVLEIPEFAMPNAIPHRVKFENDLWKVEPL